MSVRLCPPAREAAAAGAGGDATGAAAADQGHAAAAGRAGKLRPHRQKPGATRCPSAAEAGFNGGLAEMGWSQLSNGYVRDCFVS